MGRSRTSTSLSVVASPPPLFLGPSPKPPAVWGQSPGPWDRPEGPAFLQWSRALLSAPQGSESCTGLHGCSVLTQRPDLGGGLG